MTKYTRVTQKVFASQAGANEITACSIPGSEVYTSDISQIMGGPGYEAGVYPTLYNNFCPMSCNENAIHKVASEQLAYIFQNGIAEWDAGTEYYQGAICKVIDSNGDPILYKSLTNNNTNNDPTLDPVNWELLFSGLADKDLSNITATAITNLANDFAKKNGSNVDENFFTGATLTSGTVDYIVESGSNANGYYKKFKSGAIIQSGTVNVGTVPAGQNVNSDIVFPTPTSSTNYFIFLQKISNTGIWAYITYTRRTVFTTTTCGISTRNTGTSDISSVVLNYLIIEY